jgi:hypothetical protein
MVAVLPLVAAELQLVRALVLEPFQVQAHHPLAAEVAQVAEVAQAVPPDVGHRNVRVVVVATAKSCSR